MHVFKLGQPYPLHNHANGQDKARADLTHSFFGVVLYVRNPRPTEVRQWGQSFDYGLYEAAPGVPFILTRFPAGVGVFDVTLNWYLMLDSAQRAAWLEYEEKVGISFALVDADNNNLLAYRITPAAPAFVTQVRACAHRQLALFSDRFAVEQAISRAELMPLALMQRQATMFSVK